MCVIVTVCVLTCVCKGGTGCACDEATSPPGDTSFVSPVPIPAQIKSARPPTTAQPPTPNPTPTHPRTHPTPTHSTNLCILCPLGLQHLRQSVGAAGARADLSFARSRLECRRSIERTAAAACMVERQIAKTTDCLHSSLLVRLALNKAPYPPPLAPSLSSLTPRPWTLTTQPSIPPPLRSPYPPSASFLKRNDATSFSVGV